MKLQTIIYFSLVFGLSEFILMLMKRSKKKSRKIQKDKISLLLFWFIISGSLTIGFLRANHDTWTDTNLYIALFGTFFFIVGSIIRWLAILQLKKEFTVDVAITEGHKLNMSGMYKYIRHPSYLGLLLICIGLSIAMNSIISFLIITVPILAAICYRIKVEETVLIAEFGAIYTKYMSHTHRIIPKLY